MLCSVAPEPRTQRDDLQSCPDLLKRPLFSNCRSRKLNAVLESAIQEALAELDRTSAKSRTQTGQKLKRRAAEGASYGAAAVVRTRRS